MNKLRFVLATAATLIISAASAISIVDDAIMVSATESEATVTDITTSSAYHDVCLLFHDGKFDDYYPFKDDTIVRSDSRFKQYQMLACRPYGEDLYTYWYFNTLPSDSPDHVFDIVVKSAATYQIRCYFEIASSKNNIKYQSDAVDLVNAVNVGEPYHIGSEWLIKLKIENAFPNISVGDSGSAQIFGIKSSTWGDLELPEEKQQTFRYEDAEYDITAKLWGDKSKTVAVTKAEARPALFPKWDEAVPGSLLERTFTNAPDISEYGYGEVHTLFFDLDRDPSRILHMDLHYVMIEYYSEGLFDRTIDNNNNIFIDHYANYYRYQVPEGTEYVPGNSIEREYAGTQYATKQTVVHKDLYADDSFSVATIHKNAFAGWFGIPENTTYNKEFAYSIISMNPGGAPMLDLVEEDEGFKEWLQTYGKKEDGELYEYAAFFDVTDSSWTSKETREEWSYDGPQWLWGTEMCLSYRLYSAHTAQGIVSTRMTVKNELEIEDWNVFMQPVNEKPGTKVKTHNFTLNDFWISITKNNLAWVKNLAMTGYVAVTALLTLIITLAILKD